MGDPPYPTTIVQWPGAHGAGIPTSEKNWAEKIAIAKQAREAGAYMRRKEK